MIVPPKNRAKTALLFSFGMTAITTALLRILRAREIIEDDPTALQVRGMGVRAGHSG
jgi:hypothetical protein